MVGLPAHLRDAGATLWAHMLEQLLHNHANVSKASSSLPLFSAIIDCPYL